MALRTSSVEIEGVEVQIRQYPAFDGFVIYSKIADKISPVIHLLQQGKLFLALTEITGEINEEAELEEFFSLLLSCATINGTPVTVDTAPGRYEGLAILIGSILLHNFLGMWKDRSTPPSGDNQSSTYCPYTKRIDAATKQLSIPPIIYTILTSELKLATYTELCETLSVDDALNLLEVIQAHGYISNQQYKMAEAEAQNRKR
nr:hypothetical protein [uncultured Pseudomonas sp.]